MTTVYIVPFYANITKITADLLNQNPTKKVMLLNKKCFNQVLQMDMFPERQI